MKDVAFGEVESSELKVKPNLPVLGPKLGPALPDVRDRLARGEFEELDGGRFRVDGHVLEPDEVLVERVGREGWAVASEDGLTVALDTTLDDELRLEGRLLDWIHEVNDLRKESGLAVTDRIQLWHSRTRSSSNATASGSPPRLSPSACRGRRAPAGASMIRAAAGSRGRRDAPHRLRRQLDAEGRSGRVRC